MQHDEVSEILNILYVDHVHVPTDYSGHDLFHRDR